MDFTLFASILNNLLHVNVLIVSADKKELEQFQDKYCYDPGLQPCFQSHALNKMIGDMEETILYEFRDALGICMLAFLLDKVPVIVGPFVRREFNEQKTRTALVAAGLSASYAVSIKLYYGAFPIISATHAVNTVLGCIRAFSGSGVERKLCRIDDFPKGSSLSSMVYKESLDYSTLYRRYEQENHFLHLIESGDTENVLIAYEQMTLSSFSNDRYINAVYLDASVGLSMVRTLARKAAENGGASPIEIHDITQRAVQQIVASHNESEMNEYTKAMIRKLTEAVRYHKLQMVEYSAPIRRAVEYLRLNYTQEISLGFLASHVGLSDAHLSRTFKKEVGTNISQYIARLRCEEAAQLLAHSDSPIQKISAYVGYLDSNYFVKVFRKHFGITPTEYRAGKGMDNPM